MEAFTIRSETPADHEAIGTIHGAAFGQNAESLLVGELRRLDGFDAHLSLVAESADGDPTLIGHILFTPIRIESEPGSTALAPMAVLPEFQRCGIGTRLVEAGLEACRNAGHESVIVLGHPEFYSRFGFERASRFGIGCPFPGIPDPVFRALELTPGSLDEVSGTARYPLPFGAF